jgi:hypothetical protein
MHRDSFHEYGTVSVKDLPRKKNSPNSTDIMDVTIVIQKNRYILDGEEVSRENYKE